jgi:hypothetical protein
MPNSSSILVASVMMGKSESLPITTLTSTFFGALCAFIQAPLHVDSIAV